MNELPMQIYGVVMTWDDVIKFVEKYDERLHEQIGTIKDLYDKKLQHGTELIDSYHDALRKAAYNRPTEFTISINTSLIPRGFYRTLIACKTEEQILMAHNNLQADLARSQRRECFDYIRGISLGKLQIFTWPDSSILRMNKFIIGRVVSPQYNLAEKLSNHVVTKKEYDAETSNINVVTTDDDGLHKFGTLDTYVMLKRTWQ